MGILRGQDGRQGASSSPPSPPACLRVECTLLHRFLLLCLPHTLGDSVLKSHMLTNSREVRVGLRRDLREGAGWDGMEWDGMGWDGMRCDAMGCDGMGRDADD